MIARRTNRAERVRLYHWDGAKSGVTIDGRPLFSSQVPYFRTLYLRRGQWVPLSAFIVSLNVSERQATDTLERLRRQLPEGFTLEKKKELVFPEEAHQEMYHWYYRLTTPDTLPPPLFRGEATLSDTDWDEVPLEEADAFA